MSDTTFYVEGVIRITANFGGHHVHILFDAARVLATKVILGMAFIDRFVRSIETDKRIIIPRMEKPVPIIASYQQGAIPTVCFVREQLEHEVFPVMLQELGRSRHAHIRQIL